MPLVNESDPGKTQFLEYLLGTCIQRSFDEIRVCHSQTDKRRHALSSDGGSGAMHRIITNIAMFAIDNNGLHYGQWLDIRPMMGWGRCLTSIPVWATIWAVRNEGSPMNVMMGFALACRALRRRSCGFIIEPSVADGQVIVGRILLVEEYKH